MGIYVTGLPDGMSYDSSTGKVTGSATKAGIYNVSVLASDWPVDRTNNYGRTDLPNSTYKTFTITVKPTVEVTDVMSGATEVPVKVSAGSTKLTLTLPVGEDKTETVVMRKADSSDNWTVVDNYETDKSGTVTKLSDNIGKEIDGSSNEFNVPVLGVYTTPGENRIKAVVEAEQVTARLFGGEISDTGITAHYDTADKKWVTDTGDKDTAVTLRIPANASSDSDVKVVTAKYTREYNSDNVLVKTEVVKTDHNTTDANWITVTRSADGTWKSSDGTQVKAVSSVDPDKTETNANGTWDVSGNFKFATTVDSVQNENVALANITNEAPSVTTKGGKVLVNSKVDLLASKYVTQITDKEDDNDKSDHKETTVTSVVVTSPTGEKVTLTPEEAKSFEIKSEGTYTVSVTVTDSDGLTAESTYNLEAAKEVPAKITVKFQKENGDKLGDDEVIDTKLGENYTTGPGDFIGYELTAIPSNAAGVVNDESVEVIYVYKEPTPNEASKGVIVTKYVTTDGKVLDPGSVTMYDVGEKYTTSAKDFSGYKLVETPSNANGVATDDVETVTYTYKEIKKLTVYFRDKNDNKVKDPVEITYLKGEDPVLPGTDVDGYTYIEKKTLDNGDIVYVYEQKSKVTARYVDKDGKDIDKEEIALYDKGSAYTTKAKEIEGYKLVKTPTNANGTADAAETTVTYEYRAIKKIKVFFEDTEKNSVKNPVEIEYLDGENPVLPDTKIDGYTYIEKKTLDNGDIVYVYNQKAKVTARYVDKDGKDIAKEETAIYDKGSAYTTKAKDIEGYKLVKTPTNANGTADAAETTVTYEYRAIKKIKVFFEDTDKKSLKTPVELEYLDGESPVLPETSVDGYTYLRTVTLENGDLIYVFNKGNNVVEIEKPNTGDNSNVKMFSAILVIAGAIAGVVTFIRKKITK